MNNMERQTENEEIKRNYVLWFLAEITFTADGKIHIEHVISRLYDVHYGFSYLYENPKILENNRLFAVIKENGDTWIYRKDAREETGIGGGWYKAAHLEKDYDNPEALFPYCDEYVPFGEYGIIHYKY